MDDCGVNKNFGWVQGMVIRRLWRRAFQLRRYFAGAPEGIRGAVANTRERCRKPRFFLRHLPRPKFLAASLSRSWARPASGECRLWGFRRSATWWDAFAFRPWPLLRCDRSTQTE